MTKNVTAQLGLSGDTYVNPSISATVGETMSGTDSLFTTQSIATGSWQAITITPCASMDWVMLINTDATNYVEISAAADGANPFAKLSAGRFLLVPPGAATYYAQANTGACLLKKAIVEP